MNVKIIKYFIKTYKNHVINLINISNKLEVGIDYFF